MTSVNFLRVLPLCHRCSALWLKCHAPWFPLCSSSHRGLRSYTSNSGHAVNSESLIQRDDTFSAHHLKKFKYENFVHLPGHSGKHIRPKYSFCLYHHRTMLSNENVRMPCQKSISDECYTNQESSGAQEYVGKKVQPGSGEDRKMHHSITQYEWMPSLANCSLLYRSFHSVTLCFRNASLSSHPAKVFVSMNCHSYNCYGLMGSLRFYRGQTRHRVSDQNFRRERDDHHYLDKHDIDDNAEDHLERDPSAVRKTALVERQMRNFEDIQPSSSLSTDKEGPKDLPVVKKTVDDLSLPELSRIAFNIVPYVKRSATLQNLVRLGVDLSKIQKEEGIAELLIMSDFDRDIVPLVKVLTLAGVEAEKIGYVFTANPRLFKESVQDLELRIGYLVHKSFTLPEVANIISAAPVTLLMDPWMVEEKLGFLQKTFNLTDVEVRQAVMRYPKLLPRRKELIADVRFHIKEFIGFTNAELKTLILKEPKIFSCGKGALVDRFDYLHNTMLISHDQILGWPKILGARLFIFKNRHLFLLARGRAQYDPCLENYVSLEALGLYSDEEFCQKVARCTVQEFYDFCKTL